MVPANNGLRVQPAKALGQAEYISHARAWLEMQTRDRLRPKEVSKTKPCV